MFAVGDIVEIYSPIAGHKKYHVCIQIGTQGAAHQFLFLNSEGGFSGCYEVPCAQVPCLPPSDTGKTVFSFGIVSRYTDSQLKLYKAKKLGVLDKALAAALLTFAHSVQTLTRPEKRAVIDALKQIAGI